MDVEVVYISFREYGFAAYDRFLASYERHLAGLPHLLTVACKGYSAGPEREVAVSLSTRRGGRAVDVPDGGLDIGTYLHVAARSQASLLCLLNTNSIILGDDWLNKLLQAHNRQGGGAVAATGSWESLSSDELVSAQRQQAGAVRGWVRFMRRRRRFPAFPNPHLRTNALLIEREALLADSAAAPTSKEEAWLFESGRNGLSARLRRRGLPLSVVGRDGSSYRPDQWDRSGTFWQGDQGNLLVSDNQTRRYQDGDEGLRQELFRTAWRSPSDR